MKLLSFPLEKHCRSHVPFCWCSWSLSAGCWLPQGLALALVVAGGGRAEEGELGVQALRFRALGVTLCCCQPHVQVFCLHLLCSGLAPAITCTVFNYVASVTSGPFASRSPFVGSNGKIPDKCICACSPSCSLLVRGARCKLVPLYLRGCWVNCV